jgi:hypothetical protein
MTIPVMAASMMIPKAKRDLPFMASSLLTLFYARCAALVSTEARHET